MRPEGLSQLHIHKAIIFSVMFVSLSYVQNKRVCLTEGKFLRQKVGGLTYLFRCSLNRKQITGLMFF